MMLDAEADFCLGTVLRQKTKEANDEKYYAWHEEYIHKTKLKEKLVSAAEKGEYRAGFKVPEECYTKYKEYWQRFATSEKLVLEANYFDSDENGDDETGKVFNGYNLVFSWKIEV